MMTISSTVETSKEPMSYQGYFGDKRLEARGTSILANLIEKGTVILNQLATNRAELVGASRFFDNDKVSVEALVQEATTRCQQNVAGLNLLAIPDTSEINYQRHAGLLPHTDADLGPIGNNRDIGFFLHPMLVLEEQNGFPLGFSHISLFNRGWEQETKEERKYKQLPITEKESYRWLDSSFRTKAVLNQANRITIIADREADIYEEFVTVPDDRTHLLIRSLQNRCLADRSEKLFERLASLAPVGSYPLTINRGQKKRQPREALMEVKWTRVHLARPVKLSRSSYPEQVELFAIEARESDQTVPEGEEPVLWRLLTTHEITTLVDAVQIISWYSLRWLIEQLFRTLKHQGLDVESSQLEHGQGLKKLVVMALTAALRILQLVLEREGRNGKSGILVFGTDELACLKTVGESCQGKTSSQQNPFTDGSLAWAAWIIARLGGWKGYSKAGPAGPITMKRGLDQFNYLFQGWLLQKMCA
jgi:hypothetical protein